MGFLLSPYWVARRQFCFAGSSPCLIAKSKRLYSHPPEGEGDPPLALQVGGGGFAQAFRKEQESSTVMSGLATQVEMKQGFQIIIKGWLLPLSLMLGCQICLGFLLISGSCSEADCDL